MSKYYYRDAIEEMSTKERFELLQSMMYDFYYCYDTYYSFESDEGHDIDMDTVKTWIAACDNPSIISGRKWKYAMENANKMFKILRDT